MMMIRFQRRAKQTNEWEKWNEKKFFIIIKQANPVVPKNSFANEFRWEFFTVVWCFDRFFFRWKSQKKLNENKPKVDWSEATTKVLSG